MKIAILHCGHAKTGSSSLQKFLFANSDALAGAGILYPKITRPSGKLAGVPWANFQHGGFLKKVVAGNPRSNPKSHLGQFNTQIETVPHDVLVMSSEYMFKKFFYQDQRDIWEFLAARGYQVHTISYLRDQADRLASAYAQSSKSGVNPDPFDLFCTRRVGNAARVDPKAVNKFLAGGMFYDHLVKPGLHRWGKHTFRPFDGNVKKRGVVADFMETLQSVMTGYLPDHRLTNEVVAGLEQTERSNDSDGVVMVAVGKVLAQLIESDFADLRASNAMLREAYQTAEKAMDKIGIHDPKLSVLTPTRVAHLRSIFAPTNEIFSQQVWGKSWESLFPVPEPEKLVSNDLDDTHDPVLTAHYELAMKLAREDFLGRISSIREEIEDKLARKA